MSLLKQGGIVFGATIVAAFLGYLYHLFMGRMLGPADYGALASLFAFIYLFATPTGLSGAMQLTAAREMAQLKAKGKSELLSDYALFFSKKILLFAVAITTVFLLLSPFIAGFLHLDLLPVVSLAILLFFYLILIIPWGFLQGLQHFTHYSIANFLFAIFKLGAAIALVFLGFSVSGAIVGVIIGIVASAAYGLWFLRDYFKWRTATARNAKFAVKENFVFFSWGILLSLFFLMFLINIDILLVKHFFSAEEAGQYSIASLLGKLIYFLAISFATVLLPMVSESVDKPKAMKLLKNALLYTACFSVFLIAGFWFFSGFIVSVFFGEAFSGSAALLPLFGIAIALFSFSNIIVYFEMALKRNNHIPLLAFFCIAEALALWFFHSSLLEVVLVVAAANALLLVSLLASTFLKR